MTLIEFLLARIGEDEDVAWAVIARYAPDEVTITREDPWPEEVAFTARYRPARVLDDCHAKRRIVEGMNYGDIDNINEPEVLGLLAAVYSDHPDYRQEWAL